MKNEQWFSEDVLDLQQHKQKQSLYRACEDEDVQATPLTGNEGMYIIHHSKIIVILHISKSYLKKADYQRPTSHSANSATVSAITHSANISYNAYQLKPSQQQRLGKIKVLRFLNSVWSVHTESRQIDIHTDIHTYTLHSHPSLGRYLTARGGFFLVTKQNGWRMERRSLFTQVRFWASCGGKSITGRGWKPSDW